MQQCKWRDRIAEKFPMLRVEKWDDDFPCAAVADWKSGKQFLWIDDVLCTMMEGAMPPPEIIYNLSYLGPSERKEAIDGLKHMAIVVANARQNSLAQLDRLVENAIKGLVSDGDNG